MASVEARWWEVPQYWSLVHSDGNIQHTFRFCDTLGTPKSCVETQDVTKKEEWALSNLSRWDHVSVGSGCERDFSNPAQRMHCVSHAIVLLRHGCKERRLHLLGRSCWSIQLLRDVGGHHSHMLASSTSIHPSCDR